MRTPWWPTLILAGSIVSMAVGATDHDDLERNRQLLERWRLDPEHYQRLVRDQREFFALPLRRQKQLRQLDQQLHETDNPTKARLWSVLERYNGWLETLPEEQRQQITQAADAGARLALIRDLRLREKLTRLPLKQQQEVRRLPADQQPDRIAALWAEQGIQSQRWVRHRQAIEVAVAIPRPTRLSELPPATRTHVETHLLPRLMNGEKGRLGNLEGQYPGWLRLIVDLAEKHPVLPPGPLGKMMTMTDLPKGVADGIRKPNKSRRGRWVGKSGIWPEFALSIQRIAHIEKVACPPLGASKPAEFPPEIRTFLTRQLFPALHGDQKAALVKLEGHWPEYPKQLLKLARENRLVIPGMSLPGPFDMWDNVRAEADGSEHRHPRFGHHEITDEDRARAERVGRDIEKFFKNLKDRHKAEADRRRRDSLPKDKSP